MDSFSPLDDLTTCPTSGPSDSEGHHDVSAPVADLPIDVQHEDGTPVILCVIA